MAIAPVILQGGVTLGVAASTIYPATANAKITAAAFTNTSAAAVMLTVAVVRSGGASKIITPAVNVAANGVYLAPELSGLTMANGDAVTAFASAANAVNAFLSGIGGY